MLDHTLAVDMCRGTGIRARARAMVSQFLTRARAMVSWCCSVKQNWQRTARDLTEALS